ncbi:hypothetical protein REPUB_Repub02eG0267800 [Reevesia pubescens]
MGFLFAGLALMAIGARGIRPCNIAFGADQFDTTTKKGRAQLESFFNWWIKTLTHQKVQLPKVSWTTKASPRMIGHYAVFNKWKSQNVDWNVACLGNRNWLFHNMDQQNTIGILQAIQTTKTLGSGFQVPPGWIGLSSMIALAIWFFLYEQIWVP